MRRLGAVLLVLVVVVMANLMDVRPTWSGGVQWTPETNARLDGEWMDNGQTPVSVGLTGQPRPDVAIGATYHTEDLMSASWSLGIGGLLADLSPNTASFSFKGQVSATQGDDVVVSTGWGVNWVGRVDTVTQTRDTAGNWWTNIGATDRIGALGAAELVDYQLVGAGDVLDGAEIVAAAVGVSLEAQSAGTWHAQNAWWDSADTYSQSVLSFLNDWARYDNTVLASGRTGRLYGLWRYPQTPSSVLTLTGINAPSEWSLSYSIDVDINRWIANNSGGTLELGADAGDIALYGERAYDAGTAKSNLDPAVTLYADWIAYGGSQRPTASATLIVSDWSQDDLILLDPFQWVTESGTNWQVMSVSHNVTLSGWTVNVTLDNLLDLL